MIILYMDVCGCAAQEMICLASFNCSAGKKPPAIESPKELVPLRFLSLPASSCYGRTGIQTWLSSAWQQQPSPLLSPVNCYGLCVGFVQITSETFHRREHLGSGGFEPGWTAFTLSVCGGLLCCSAEVLAVTSGGWWELSRTRQGMLLLTECDTELIFSGLVFLLGVLCSSPRLER